MYRSTRIDVSAYKVPTDAPESDGTYRWEATTLVLVEVQAGGKTGLGYSYADTATARADARPAGGGRPGPGCHGRGRVRGRRWSRRSATSAARDCLDGDLRRRRGPLGPEGPSARLPLVTLLGAVQRSCAGLRQRRFHLVFDRAAPRTARRLGRRGHPAGQDEDRPRSGRGPRPGPRRPRGHRAGGRALRRRQRRL